MRVYVYFGELNEPNQLQNDKVNSKKIIARVVATGCLTVICVEVESAVYCVVAHCTSRRTAF